MRETVPDSLTGFSEKCIMQLRVLVNFVWLVMVLGRLYFESSMCSVLELIGCKCP